MKLLTQKLDSGVMARCDARCYDAKAGGHCDCVCGGRNHGVGLAKALANIVAMVRDNNLKGTTIRVTRAAERAIERRDQTEKREENFQNAD
jgi:hypothetical protein